MAEQQLIPARHAVATFVPAGQTIKIINSSGTQVVDTWAFALPQPAPKKDVDQRAREKEEAGKEETAKAAEKVKAKNNFPNQEEAEKATKEAQVQAEQAEKEGAQKKTGWSTYVPSISTLGLGKKEENDGRPESNETQQQKDSRTWATYFKPGKGFGSYIPQQATDTVNKLVSVHYRDTNKSYLEQLTDFSKTPVGAAGMSALTGSGYGGSFYAGYQAWNAKNAADAPNTEYMSMGHSRVNTLHLVPQPGDTLVTNLRQPILTLVEDHSPGVHDTLIPACDPARYEGLGVHKWEEHGSCAENLVLALKELNERAGLKGAKAVGADVTVNSAPAPLNLFMNIPWEDDGNISFQAPRSSRGDFVRLRAERDAVVVMSACPNDVQDINGEEISDAMFIVEEEAAKEAINRTQPAKKTVPQKKKTPGTTPGTSAPTTTPARKKPPPASPTVSAKNSSTQATRAPKAAPPTKKPPPVKARPSSPPSKTPGPAASEPVQSSKPAKKPVPAAVKSQVKRDSEASPTPVVEKKKPRKLTRKDPPAA
jgi:uncharacterized protein YcgI (DUF1989 family)